ncbi:MAG: macrolide ABC transporter permease/ATP-binding protein MacB [Rhodovulum sulfidophilum]|uniref:Macrolide ABC transporter permease/ATP-binding protein MacB n=1 Tax=Rhodovulum sulfidophilum TaxID=35806 RepID=A0A2W5NB50_RHOSU|nr:MAG: macrolide ABC transporter permease/ATP-binding protein MacB [Rhodovulum sulfidophilum]
MTGAPSCPTWPLIELSGVGRVFHPGAARPALEGIDLRVEAGEFVAIIGASGSGKSTLMNIIGLLDRPSTGAYRLNGVDVATLGRDARARLRQEMVGFVFQDYHLIEDLDVARNVELPAVHAGVPREPRERRALELLRGLGLGDRGRALPSDLSGGQQQRVAIARALMNGAPLILADEPTGALDSRTGAEVLRLLSELSAAGHTIVLITHDAKVAATAHRRVEIADGRIVADSGRASPEAAALRTGRAAPRRASPLAMVGEAARLALAALAASPVRTVLTLLGIVIGVAALIATSAIGRGTEVALTEQAGALGTDWVVVGSMSGAEVKGGRPLTPADAEALGEIPNVAAVMPAIWHHVTVQAGNRTTSVEALGTSPALIPVHGWDAARGDFFTEADMASNAPVAVLGATVADKLFPDDPDPAGEFVLVQGMPFLVTGIMARKGVDEQGQDRDDTLVLPLGTAIHRLVGKDNLTAIIAKIADMGGVGPTQEAIRTLLRERHGREDFWLWDATATFREAEQRRATTGFLVLAVTGLSVLVGGIGIMNIMLMSVQQRRREIGIRTATGATTRDVLRQFLTEALVLAVMGALAGLVLGVGIAAGTAVATGTTVIFSIRLAVAAVLGAALIGFAFGLAPALRAARLDPVKALAG